VRVETMLVYAIFLLGVPFAGVVLARTMGPLTWIRGVIGAATLPFALCAGELLLAWVHRQPVPAGRFYPSAAAWIVGSAVVGAAIVALWRTADRRRGLDKLPSFDRR